MQYFMGGSVNISPSKWQHFRQTDMMYYGAYCKSKSLLIWLGFRHGVHVCKSCLQEV